MGDLVFRIEGEHKKILSLNFSCHCQNHVQRENKFSVINKLDFYKI